MIITKNIDLLDKKSIIEFQCESCDQPFTRTKSFYTRNGKCERFCSVRCFHKSRRIGENTICTQCNKYFKKAPSQILKTRNHFCSHSCSATYNNMHKTKGYRRSKLEIWLEQELITLYPDLHILFNDKAVINSELDIYIPSLQLAFELNGIFHYEPIYGVNKLNQIQNNDANKFQLCIQNSVSLCIIDTSKFINFKPIKAQKYLDIISSLIDNKWKETNGIEPLRPV